MNLQIQKAPYLRIKAIPSSPKNEITEIMEDEKNGTTYKIRIKAPPQKGKANKELIRFLSKELNVPKENIEIISGQKEQLKLIRISQI